MIKEKNKGPWLHRVLIGIFTLLLGLLLHWFLGFVIRDIGTLPITPFEQFKQAYVDQSVLAESEQLRVQVATVARQIRQQQERQALLRDSTSASQQTMNQLLELQRLALEKGIGLTDQEQAALAQSKELFLSNQQRYQALNENIAELKEEERRLRERLAEFEAVLQRQHEQAQAEYNQVQYRHHLKVAALKLLVLIPLAAVVGYLFLKRRNTLYAPLIYAAGVALLVRIGLVLHEHFPTKYFKYILLLVAVGVVGQILVYLLRMLAFPKREWLLKQFREAYERFLCPICSYPIRRGPLRYAFWTPRTLKKAAVLPPGGAEPDEPYTCPNCATKLFDQCDVCHAVRHCLLPACEKCGAEKAPSELPT